jgi:prepilin-type N-terminal cleavage/methylation domain-containing protein
MFNLIYKNKGFTLLEIILAIAVVSIIGVAFFGFFANSARIIKSTDVREKALILAQQEMESLKAKGFNDIEDEILPSTDYFDSNDNFSQDNYSSFDAVDGYPDYSIDITIEEIEEDLYKLVVISNWNENAANKSIDLTSYVANRGEE